MNDKIEYIVMFISEFSKKHHLTGRQAYRYLKEFLTVVEPIQARTR